MRRLWSRRPRGLPASQYGKHRADLPGKQRSAVERLAIFVCGSVLLGQLGMQDGTDDRRDDEEKYDDSPAITTTVRTSTIRSNGDGDVCCGGQTSRDTPFCVTMWHCAMNGAGNDLDVGV